MLGEVPGGPSWERGWHLVLGLLMNRVHKQRVAESIRWWLERGSDIWGFSHVSRAPVAHVRADLAKALSLVSYTPVFPFSREGATRRKGPCLFVSCLWPMRCWSQWPPVSLPEAVLLVSFPQGPLCATVTSTEGGSSQTSSTAHQSPSQS